MEEEQARIKEITVEIMWLDSRKTYRAFNINCGHLERITTTTDPGKCFETIEKWALASLGEYANYLILINRIK